eukprot:g19438.t1
MVSEFFEAIWTYIKRRGSFLALSLMYTFTAVPMQFWGSIAKHRDGVGFFADPLGKASLLTYWQGLAESTFGIILLLKRRPADLAFEAVQDSDDGVVVVDKGNYMEFIPPGQQQELTAKGATDRPLVGVVILPGMLVPPRAYALLPAIWLERGTLRTSCALISILRGMVGKGLGE